MKPCPRCGYVPGATTGYEPLTDVERRQLEQAGYVLTQNIFGEDLARPEVGGYGFNTARFWLHRVRCKRTCWDLLARQEAV
jgi:hypothetical protein